MFPLRQATSHPREPILSAIAPGQGPTTSRPTAFFTADRYLHMVSGQQRQQHLVIFEISRFCAVQNCGAKQQAQSTGCAAPHLYALPINVLQRSELLDNLWV
jgi:hypothetical protein